MDMGMNAITIILAGLDPDDYCDETVSEVMAHRGEYHGYSAYLDAEITAA